MLIPAKWFKMGFGYKGSDNFCSHNRINLYQAITNMDFSRLFIKMIIQPSALFIGLIVSAITLVGAFGSLMLSLD